MFVVVRCQDPRRSSGISGVPFSRWEMGVDDDTGVSTPGPVGDRSSWRKRAGEQRVELGDPGRRFCREITSSLTRRKHLSAAPRGRRWSTTREIEVQITVRDDKWKSRSSEPFLSFGASPRRLEDREFSTLAPHRSSLLDAGWMVGSISPETTTAERPTSLHWGLSTDASNQDVVAACRLVDSSRSVVISCRRVERTKASPTPWRLNARSRSRRRASASPVYPHSSALAPLIAPLPCSIIARLSAPRLRELGNCAP